MSEGRHAIVTTSGAMAVLAGVFTDDEFYALPVVREFGAFPSGYAAIHFGEDETERRLAGLPRDPRDARAVLAELRAALLATRYAVRVGSRTLSRHATKAAAERALRDVVQAWRAGDLFETQTSRATRRGNGYSAPRIGARARHGSHDAYDERTGALRFAWNLQTRGRSVGIARVDDDGVHAGAQRED